ncbi:hypothetical protein AB4037_04405 [Labrys sp. KB_33_2]|uniref:hypothetical protein n=1 Tax=Labrys TaxID=204476 RepID=UPI0015E452FD|nr:MULTISPECIES: hypothetical protein [Labrys]MBP0581320.1 hypothetical protein [Labrys sp. LIt4]
MSVSSLNPNASSSPSGAVDDAIAKMEKMFLLNLKLQVATTEIGVKNKAADNITRGSKT